MSGEAGRGLPRVRAGVRVLVIDDDDFVRSGLVADLVHAGYQVDQTGDPREGLERIRESPPDAVLLDVMMHGIDGISVLQELRGAQPDLPVVMITGHGSMESALDALRAGASDYIQKPAFGEDVAHRIQLAIQAEQGRRLQKQAESYEEKVASLQTLAGGVAHDLNNQLTVIMNSTQELMDRLQPGNPGHADLKWIAYSSSVISRLAERLLSYSGGGNFVIRPTDLTGSVPEMLEKISRRLREETDSAVQLEIEMPMVPVWVAVDRRQFFQALDHVVTNAFEALEQSVGGVVRVQVGLREVDTPLAASMLPSANVVPGMYASLRVEDNGPGMDPETREKIFDPFFSTKFTGRGMGLPSAQGVFRGHRGHLFVSTVPGQGTVVEGLLPLARSDEEGTNSRIAPMAVPTQVEPPPDTGRLRSRGHVLIIDDEVLIRRMTDRALTKIGFRVSQAEDGAEGIKIFRRNPGDIDLILLDLSMPEMDGVAVLRALRAVSPAVRVLLVSGFHSTEAADRFTDQRPDGFLQKPFSVVDLRERVTELVER